MKAITERIRTFREPDESEDEIIRQYAQCIRAIQICPSMPPGSTTFWEMDQLEQKWRRYGHSEKSLRDKSWEYLHPIKEGSVMVEVDGVIVGRMKMLSELDDPHTDRFLDADTEEMYQYQEGRWYPVKGSDVCELILSRAREIVRSEKYNVGENGQEDDTDQ